ncbi:MAG: hypothetical protein GTO63_18560 [Anaerolineae bacterium]|nr:hypothetical protein [Anaerolineae bacterium]NIN96773.1 hypothetical protein [Anaerolineae bacterium]NIQ79769.1 hypothetical protein [Anaerolineae bacterium]
MTAAACARETCDGCPIEGRLLCLHTLRDAFDFAFLAIGFFIPFLAGMVIGGFWLGLALWVVLAIIFFVYVEALVLCRHCPHYAEEGFTLRCHANYGLPKIPRFSPRPLSRMEKLIFLGYVALLGLYYVPFFALSQQWLLLAITTWAVITWAWTLLRTQCTRCYHVSCPLNRVPANVREKFFNNYPAFSEARNERQP